MNAALATNRAALVHYEDKCRSQVARHPLKGQHGVYTFLDTHMKMCLCIDLDWDHHLLTVRSAPTFIMAARVQQLSLNGTRWRI